MIRMAEAANLDAYLSDGKQAFMDALEAARGVYEDGDALQADIDNAYQTLFDTFMALVPKADKAMLDALIVKAESLQLDQYIEAGKDALAKALLNAKAVSAYEEAVQAKGKAKLGEKTFLDAFHPAVAAFGKALSAGDGGKAAFEKAALAAEEGFRRARTMRAVHGKAAVKGEASREMDDPGAAVAVLMMQAAAKTGG